ncbi:DUF58 domain-containing protein [Microbacterium sp. ASV49]|uniref:DUF58 domain-containing protein n=1 Tax=Microbacterium candidum TaxID=3041922 RepID=A0ABT7MXH9_9MICO|nr:DUF58 domain-containing protein [Microbacterium sp. ASV49]MDL9979148.1 DUF58 domain-containing protein [Microbacterium sp. ASV49]
MTIPTAPTTRTTTAGRTAVAETTVHARVTARRAPLVRAAIAVAAAWGRGTDAAARGAREVGATVAPAGWLVIVAVTAGLAAGLAFGWVEAIVAALSALVLLILSVPFLFGARGYDVALHVAHDRVVAGTSVDAELRVRNAARTTALPGRVDLPIGDGLVEVAVPLLRPGQRLSRTVSIPALRRGVIPVGPAVTIRTDPVGLVRREREWDEMHELYVHPRTVAVPATSAGLVRDLEGSASRRLVDSDISFHAIREYVPGDARRQIHWKSTAKTGQLMVRQFEESLRSRLAVVLSLAERDYFWGDPRSEQTADGEFELAVSVAASLSVQAVREGRDLDVVSGAEIPRVAQGRMRAIRSLSAPTPRTLLDGFSQVSALERTMPLEDVCRLVVETMPDLSLAFIVCGSTVSVERLRRAALAFPIDTAVVAVVCDERAHPRRRPTGALTVLTVGVLDDLAGLLARGAQT